MTRNMYNRQFWQLCYCVRCGRLNYAEPYQTIAKCECSRLKTQHKSIPEKYLDAAGTVYNGPPRIKNEGEQALDANQIRAVKNDAVRPATPNTVTSARAIQRTELDAAPCLSDAPPPRCPAL